MRCVMFDLDGKHGRKGISCRLTLAIDNDGISAVSTQDVKKWSMVLSIDEGIFVCLRYLCPLVSVSGIRNSEFGVANMRVILYAHLSRYHCAAGCL
jgi:hypothetical protein